MEISGSLTPVVKPQLKKRPSMSRLNKKKRPGNGGRNSPHQKMKQKYTQGLTWPHTECHVKD